MDAREQAIVVTLVAYKVVLLVIGFLASRYTRDDTEFYLGGRRLGPAIAALSASASSSSAWTMLGVSGAAYAWGLASLWIFPACVGGFLLNWYVLAPALHALSHREGTLTVTDILAGPRTAELSRAISTVAAGIVVFSFTAYVAAQFQGAGKTFHQTFGTDPDVGILIGAGIVVLYTLFGGFWAVSISDTLQGVMMMIASVLIPVAALAAVGGPARLVDGLGSVGQPGYLSLTREMAGPTAVGFVLGVLGIGLGYPGQPHVVNRFMALEDQPRAIARARRIAIGWAVVVYAGMILTGLCGRLLYGDLPDAETVLVAAAGGLLHPVLAGVMLAAVLSAIMSTADSQLLVAASAITHDLGLDGGAARARVRRARVVVLVVSVAAVGAAMVGSREIFSRVLFAWTALGNAFGPLLLVRVLKGPVLPKAALGAMVLGFGLSVAAYSVEGARGTAWERVVPFVVAGGVAWWERGWRLDLRGRGRGEDGTSYGVHRGLAARFGGEGAAAGAWGLGHLRWNGAPLESVMPLAMRSTRHGSGLRPLPIRLLCTVPCRLTPTARRAGAPLRGREGARAAARRRIRRHANASSRARRPDVDRNEIAPYESSSDQLPIRLPYTVPCRFQRTHRARRGLPPGDGRGLEPPPGGGSVVIRARRRHLRVRTQPATLERRFRAGCSTPYRVA